MGRFNMFYNAVFTVVCSLIMAGMSLAPMSVSAEEAGNVRIGNTDLYNGDTLVCGNGTATYQDGILTLDNATIEDASIRMSDETTDLTINLIGQNSIKNNNGGGISVWGDNLTITGGGTLSIYCRAYRYFGEESTGTTAINGRHVWILDCGGVTIDTDGEGIITWYTLHADENNELIGNRKQSYLTVKNSTLNITNHSKRYYFEEGIFANYIDIENSAVSVSCDYEKEWGIGTRDRITISGNSEVIVSNGFGHYSSDNPVLSIGGDSEVLVGDSISGDDAVAMDGSPFKGGVSFSEDAFEKMSRAFVHIKSAPGEQDDVLTSDTGECHHNYEWETYRQATATTDGVMRYRCTYCGDVEYEVPTAAYYVFNKETQESIRKASQGATVTISTPIFISFHEMVKDALIARPDVTLVIDYKNAGEEYEMTIPAGSGEILGRLFGDSQYAGFLYLSGAFSSIQK